MNDRAIQHAITAQTEERLRPFIDALHEIPNRGEADKAVTATRDFIVDELLLQTATEIDLAFPCGHEDDVPDDELPLCALLKANALIVGGLVIEIWQAMHRSNNGTEVEPEHVEETEPGEPEQTNDDDKPTQTNELVTVYRIVIAGTADARREVRNKVNDALVAMCETLDVDNTPDGFIGMETMEYQETGPLQ